MKIVKPYFRSSLAVILLLLVAFPIQAHSSKKLEGSLKHLVSLTGAVAVGSSRNLVTVGDSQEFVVPAGKVFILKDVVVSPQYIPPTGYYIFQVLPSSGSLFTTALTVTSSGEDPSSFQVHLSSGMLFKSGSNVRVYLNPSSENPINVSVFGYLKNE